MSTKKIKKTSRKIVPRRAVKRIPLARRLARFVPAIAFFVSAAVINLTPTIKAHTTHGVLGYATSVNSTDLLASTNAQRATESVGNLSLNAQLTSAAQAKADDMVNKDYWSHVSPDGKQPWDFMAAAGYSYKAAGENLAYGFATSSDTVTGWMNSPPHRQNLMNTAFFDVGFGYANSANFVGSGEETVVVAMYGAVLGATAPAPAVATPPTAPKVQPSSQTPVAAPVEEQPISTPIIPEPVAEEQAPAPAETSSANPVTPEALVAAPTNVSRIQVLTSGNASWSSTLLVASLSAVGILWVLQRGRQIKQLLLEGEHFLLRHAHFDLAFLGFLTLGWTLLQTSGVIR